MGWRMAATWRPFSLRISATRRLVWLLPEPVRTAQTETTGLRLLIIVSSGPRRTKLAPAAMDLGGLVHDVGVGEVAVGEMDVVDLVVGDELVELGLGLDRDALGIELAGQDRGILAALDVRDLRRREGDDPVVGVVTEVGVEVVEVAPGGAHDDDLFHAALSFLI